MAQRAMDKWVVCIRFSSSSAVPPLEALAVEEDAMAAAAAAPAPSASAAAAASSFLRPDQPAAAAPTATEVQSTACRDGV